MKPNGRLDKVASIIFINVLISVNMDTIPSLYQFFFCGKVKRMADVFNRIIRVLS